MADQDREASDSTESALAPPVKPFSFYDFGDIADAPHGRSVGRHVNGSTRYRIRVGGDNNRMPIGSPSTVTVWLSHETDAEYAFTVRDESCSFTPEVYEQRSVRPNKRTTTVRIKTFGATTLEIVAELKSKPSRGPTLIGIEERYSSTPASPTLTCVDER